MKKILICVLYFRWHICMYVICLEFVVLEVKTHSMKRPLCTIAWQSKFTMAHLICCVLYCQHREMRIRMLGTLVAPKWKLYHQPKIVQILTFDESVRSWSSYTINQRSNDEMFAIKFFFNNRMWLIRWQKYFLYSPFIFIYIFCFCKN